MLSHLAKISAPLFGKGKIKIEWSADFKKWEEAEQLSTILQIINECRIKHSEITGVPYTGFIGRGVYLDIQDDARNAEDIRRAG